MKLFWSLVLALIALGVALPFLDRVAEQAGAVAPEGRAPTAPADRSDFLDGAERKTGELYRWRDARGTLHIESAPPPPGIEAEVLRYDVPAPVDGARARAPGLSTEPGVPADPGADPGAGRRSDLGDHPLRAYTPDGLEALLDEAAETSRQLEERNRTLEALEGAL